VFSDNHIFKRLYGVPSPSPAEVDELLALLEMTGTTKIEDREFETVELSSGQRKRLALLSSALEHRPILVLDEWAADQDPHFRKRFYTEILEWLKRRGMTIIAVTHDDRYYRHADRILEMLEGRIVADRNG
jgi:putative ATP-binding cassette transporter